MAIASAESRFPRWLVIGMYPIAAFALTGFFIFLGFPYDLLAERLSHEVESSTDVRLEIGELSPHIGLLGPGLAASNVLAGREGHGTIAIDELVIRPAWSTAWFRGTPAIHLDLASESGAGSGVATLGEQAGWEGSLEGVELSALPIRMLDAFDLDGRLDATVAVQNASADAGGGLEGSVDFSLTDGSFKTPDLPIAVPFEELRGRLDFGGESYLRLSAGTLEGPMLRGTIEGTVGYAPEPGRQPLALDFTFEVNDPSLAPLLGSLGRRGPNGQSVLKVTGTLAQPVLR